MMILPSFDSVECTLPLRDAPSILLCVKLLSPQIRKFLGSFRYIKSVNFLGVPVRRSQIRKFFTIGLYGTLRMKSFARFHSFMAKPPYTSNFLNKFKRAIFCRKIWCIYGFSEALISPQKIGSSNSKPANCKFQFATFAEGPLIFQTL